MDKWAFNIGRRQQKCHKSGLASRSKLVKARCIRMYLDCCTRSVCPPKCAMHRRDADICPPAASASFALVQSRLAWLTPSGCLTPAPQAWLWRLVAAGAVDLVRYVCPFAGQVRRHCLFRWHWAKAPAFFSTAQRHSLGHVRSALSGLLSQPAHNQPGGLAGRG